MSVATLCNWRVACMLPLFFCANVFYSYQQNDMFGGLLIGLLLDLPMLERPGRARLGWVLLFVTGMATWGDGYQFQRWQDARHAQGLSYCYWLMGTQSNSMGRAAVLVGAYKVFQAAGGAMAWRINTQHTSAMKQLVMNYGLSIGSLVLALRTVLGVTKSTSVLEEAGAAVPSEKVGEKTVEDL
ncbi:hypothetical protein LX36DRAFT_731743 [Colletotrichum falcatum]|nr:hypothetical protein LX36DRAFT_731743 [Colletotrichum falcatum]